MRIEASDIRVILLQGLQTPSTAALDFPPLTRGLRGISGLYWPSIVDGCSCVDNSLRDLEKAAR